MLGQFCACVPKKEGVCLEGRCLETLASEIAGTMNMLPHSYDHRLTAIYLKLAIQSQIFCPDCHDSFRYYTELP
jgi:hypothetical protein